MRKLLRLMEDVPDVGYIGTVGEGLTAEIIRDYIERQGNL